NASSHADDGDWFATAILQLIDLFLQALDRDEGLLERAQSAGTTHIFHQSTTSACSLDNRIASASDSGSSYNARMSGSSGGVGRSCAATAFAPTSCQTW